MPDKGKDLSGFTKMNGWERDSREGLWDLKNKDA